MNKGLLTRRKVKEKEGVVIVEELSETTFGKQRGRFQTKDISDLFKLIKGTKERKAVMNYAIKNKVLLSEVVKNLKREKEELR
jgi:hypothetical protein